MLEKPEIKIKHLSLLAAIVSRSGETPEEAVDRAAKILDAAWSYVFREQACRDADHERTRSELVSRAELLKDRIGIPAAFKEQMKLPNARYKTEKRFARALADHRFSFNNTTSMAAVKLLLKIKEADEQKHERERKKKKRARKFSSKSSADEIAVKPGRKRAKSEV